MRHWPFALKFNGDVEKKLNYLLEEPEEINFT